jgi:hypothetical protein
VSRPAQKKPSGIFQIVATETLVMSKKKQHSRLLKNKDEAGRRVNNVMTDTLRRDG